MAPEADVALSPRELENGAEVTSAVEVDRIGRGGGGLAIVAARVRIAGRRTEVARVVLALQRPGGKGPLCIRIRDGEELDRLIASLEAARRELERQSYEQGWERG